MIISETSSIDLNSTTVIELVPPWFSPLEVTNPDSSSTSDYSQENDFWSSGVFEAGHARNACQCRFDTLAFFGINDRMIEMYFWSISNCLNEQFWSRLQVGEKNTIQHMIYRLL